MPVLSNRERIGTTVGGRYEIRKLLGEGGMGAVFAAQHKFTKRAVAVKVLQPEYAQNADATARFLQEAQAATAINHVNIVQVLDMGVDESQTVYLVLEFLEGEDLAARLHSLRQLSVNETFDVLLPVMNALASAHAKGIIHRDLKPANIFLATQEDGTRVPKLLDFGISKISSGEALARTSTGAILGTPYYMAPEQARGERGIDRQVDIWSMGVVMYQCLSGQLPFVADNYNQMILKLVMDEAPRLETLVPSLPKAVVDIVHKALAKDRAVRFGSMEQFIAAVLGYLQSNNTRQFKALQNLASIETDPTMASMATYDAASRDSAPAAVAATTAMPVRAANALASGGTSESDRLVPGTSAPLVPPTHMNWEGRGGDGAQPRVPSRRLGVFIGIAVAVLGIGTTVAFTSIRGSGNGSAGRAPTANASVAPPIVAPPSPIAPATPATPAPAAVVPAVAPANTPAPVDEHAAAPATGGPSVETAAHHTTRTSRASRTHTATTATTATTPNGGSRPSGSGPGMMGWGER